MAYSAETGSLGLAIQPVKGTFTQPTDFMKVQSIDINPEGEKIIPDVEIGSGQDITEVYQGTYKISGSVDSYIRPEAIGVLFYGALGKYTTSGSLGSGAYLHNFVASGVLPWLSVKKTVAEDIQIFDYTDCKVEGFQIDVNSSEPATAKFDIVGISDAIGTAPSENYESSPMLIAVSATVNIGGVAVSAKKVSINYKNNLENSDFRVGSRFLGDITEKRREIDLSMDIVLDTTSELYRKSFYGTAAASSAGFSVYSDRVDIVLSSPTNIGTSALPYKILITIKNAVFMAAPTPAKGDELVVIPLELKATKSGAQNVFEVHIWNGKVSY
jgi:hypothetical protein